MNINKIVLILSFIITFSIFTNNDSYAQDCVDLMTPSEWNCGTWEYSQTETFYYDEYDWEITIVYDVRTCKKKIDDECFLDSTTIKQIRLKSIDWDYDLCPALTQHIMPGYPGTFVWMDHRFAELMHASQNYLSELLYLDYYNGLTSQEKSLESCSGTYPNCNPPDDLDCRGFVVSYIKSQCISLCVRDCDGISVAVWPCSNTACCEVKSYFCVCVNPNDPNDIIVNRYDITSASPDDCSTHLPPPGMCPAGPCVIHHTPCEIYCPD